MTHVEHGHLQAYLDGEVDAGTSVEIENHLKSCASCLGEMKALQEAAQAFATAMRGVDIAAPARPAIAMTAARKPAGLWLSRGALSRAAIMLLGVAALASAAIPGSPVRKWLSDKLGSDDVVRQTTPVTTAPEPAPIPTTPAEAAAISIMPAEGRVVVVLTNVAKSTVLHTKIVEGGKAQVQATGEAARARFRTGPGRLEMIGVKGGEVTVEIPRGALARVVADGKVIYENK